MIATNLAQLLILYIMSQPQGLLLPVFVMYLTGPAEEYRTQNCIFSAGQTLSILEESYKIIRWQIWEKICSGAIDTYLQINLEHEKQYSILLISLNKFLINFVLN